MLIGLTGRIASGKGEIAEYLKKKGFEYMTISQVIREEAAKIKIPVTRESLQDLGDLIRKHEGSNGWIKRMVEKIDLKKNFIIDGIRNPGEIKELKKLMGFVLISVDCPQEIRFERVLKRDKPSDPKVWEEFVKIDDRDFFDLKNPFGQQVGACMKLADFSIINNSKKEEFNKKIDDLFKKILEKN